MNDDSTQSQQVNTSGGVNMEGRSINMSDAVGRDKIEDRSTEIGKMNNVTGAAIGGGATSITNVTNITYPAPLPAPGSDSIPPASLPDPSYKDFWMRFLGGSIPENLNVVLSDKGTGHEHEEGEETQKSGHTVKVSYNEVDAVMGLQNRLQSIGINLKLVHSGIENWGDKELIVVGSPNANAICRQIMDNSGLNLPYHFLVKKISEEKKYKCISTEQGVLFPANYEDSEKLGKDFGIIAKVINPLSGLARRKALILAGNHGFGTESAVSFIAAPKFVNSLLEQARDNDFIAIFEAFAGKQRGFTLNFCLISVLIGGKWFPLEWKG